jgi:gallate dioxygenase
MATIVGALALSHTPTIGFALDKNKRADPQWAPIFEAFQAPRRWLSEVKPDAMIVIYNDHVTSFFLDHYSAFALGIGDEFTCADEGGGVRDVPNLRGHPKLAMHIAHSLSAEEFDLSIFQGLALDHGIFSPLSMLHATQDHRGNANNESAKIAWDIPVIPLQVGVLQFPMPSAKRCLNLGRALRRAVESFPQNLNVVIVATGGLSHQVHGERAGFNNPAWDQEFLNLIENDPDKLAQLTQAELASLGGMEGAEVIMWLVMRGALSANVKKLAQSYYLPSMTGIATVIFENCASTTIASEAIRQRQLADLQLSGSDKLLGSYPYTIERSVKAFRVNRFLHAMTIVEHRNKFLSDEEASYTESQLTFDEKHLLRTRDWRGLIHYGVIFFVLEKFAAVIGQSNLDVYAAMRNQSLQEFLKTRNAPNAIYSVAASKQ